MKGHAGYCCTPLFQKMKLKSIIMDESAVRRSMTRITHEIIEKNNGTEDLCLLGIRRRGVPLAAMLQENLKLFEGKTIPLGSVDISLYRDDLSELSDTAQTGTSEIPFDITGKKVILVDDVIYTGRTARAAIEAVFHFGRPKSIQLAVLIDRGHRELPIRADYVGKNIPTSHTEMVSVMVNEYDGKTGVCLYQL
jgi:pyrimidine operon attenuation protein/uracil phosphoribosyltransferase